MVEPERRRLTSWKEIAAYVGRDVRTVLRWEKERGLPVHRVPGATGRVIFAYPDELDAWLHGDAVNPAIAEFVPAPGPESAPVPPVADAPMDTVPASRIRPGAAVAAGVAAVALIGGAVAFLGSRTQAAPLRLEVNDTAIVARAEDGGERWRHLLPAGQKVLPVPGRFLQPADVLDRGDLIVGTAYTMRSVDGMPRGGELFRFAPDGGVKNTFSFEDRVQFGDGPYGGPWVITDYRAQARPDGRARIAVAAHHFEWWPSLVTILDDRWKRTATFVNAGWVEQLHWIAPDRLVMAGFSNDLDGGMIALLDAGALDGQSPVHDQRFACATCGRAAPLRYVVFPRSEVNLVSGARFNRAVMTLKEDGIVVRTIEKPADANAPDALYELTPSLELVRATYSDRYWDLHRELEAAGRIAHTQQQCPERDGPREIRVWEPETGWTPIATAALRPPASRAQTRR